MNTVQLVGNVGKKPELKKVKIGEKKYLMITTLAIATNDFGKDGKKFTDWHSCKVFGKLAKTIAENLEKGSKVAVVGKLKSRSWEKDGVKRYGTDIVVDKIEFLSPKKQKSGGEEFFEDIPDADNIEDMGGAESDEAQGQDNKLPF